MGGENRFETSIEISKNFKISKEVIIVNSKSIPDMLCASILASQINSPILLTKYNKIDNKTIEEIKRLETEKVYIIGGKSVIHKNVENQIKENNLNIERISGKDRYETSVQIANKINIISNEKCDEVIVVNGQETLVDAISIAPVGGSKNIPIILSKSDNIEHGYKWIKDKYIDKTYVIGGKDSICNEILKKLPSPKRISGKDRYETNGKIIREFYPDKLNKVYYCKGNSEDLVDGVLITPLATKEQSTIVVLGESIDNTQKEVLKGKEIKKLIQVGYGIHKNAKNELISIKENYKPPKPVNPPTKPTPPIKPEESIPPAPIEPPTEPEESIPPTPIEPPTEPEESIPPTTIEPPLEIEDKLSPNYVNHSIDNEKRIINIEFDEDIDSNVDYIKEKIKIEVDPNCILKLENKDFNTTLDEVKYIKLSKYDDVKIDNNNLIIKLQEEIVGKDSKIIIEKESIKDKYGNIIEEDIIIENLDGVDKNIAFVKNEDEIRKYIKIASQDKETIIKLENHIKIATNNYLNINNKVTIDGSNGEENYSIETLSLQNPGIFIGHDGVELRNFNIKSRQESISIQMCSDIKLKNMNIETQSEILPAISISSSNVKVDNIVGKSNKSTISLNESYIKNRVSKLILEGRVTNSLNDENVIKSSDTIYSKIPSIYVENKITEDVNTPKNKIILGENLEKDYINNNYEIINQSDEYKTYELYFEI
ncbi:cell wall-binding repeat-containing protein [Romboutsia hominis]|uniref:cell wall-binding repeat-containing protein n=1 Tax=Romboutsia hominis TaxID=1507512 RepID=UPI00241D62B6|nr:cell wall-binding repeat-containing protein [Romboutsia hominis]